MAANSFENVWQKRMPGEQWLTLDSPETAEVYLASLNIENAMVCRESFPNAAGLYARIRYPGRIPENKVFVASVET
jgi:hypothetical protein